jgi:hypothetical protein
MTPLCDAFGAGCCIGCKLIKPTASAVSSACRCQTETTISNCQDDFLFSSQRNRRSI